jgi:signal peptidase I
MEPTFLNGQYLIVDELTYHFNAPKRGEVIIFRYPKDPSEFFIKRIVGLPGETVMVRNGQVEIKKVDGTIMPLNEPYVVNLGNGPDADYPVAQNEYFVMGDNRPESSDSRSWGLLPRNDIIGRAFIRLLPFSTAGIFPGSTNQPQ